MTESTNLIVCIDKCAQNKNLIISLLSGHCVPFVELTNIDCVLPYIADCSKYIVIDVGTKEFFDKLCKKLNDGNDYSKRVFVLSPISIKTKYNNPCFHNDIEDLKSFLGQIFKCEYVNIKPKTQSLLNYLIGVELENLGISKKYVGFKYLVDFAAITLSNPYFKYSYAKMLGLVASLNNEMRDTIDHDMRHALLTTWKNNPALKNAISLNIHSKIQPGAKAILAELIEYIKDVM